MFAGKMFLAVVCGVAGHALAANLPATTPEETLALAERTLAYVAQRVDAKTLKPYADELKADRAWLAEATNNPAYRASVGREIARLRRRILFLHPDLQFDRLLAVQRGIPYHLDPHEVDQYEGRYSRPGPGLVAIENWRDVPRKRTLLDGKLPEGTVLNPDLHWNADRVLFAFCDHTAKPKADGVALKIHPDVSLNFRAWHRAQDPTSPLADPTGKAQARVAHRRYFIYEAAADGSWVRQITGTPDDPMETKDGRQTVLVEDVDPCYLPDGGFAFTSTRGQNFGRCHWGRWTPSFLLYRGELPPVGARCGASLIRQLSFGEANEWEPAVLDDGRIAYTRWDYVNRNAVWHQSLWTTRPDGTGTAHLYGNYSENLCVETEIKAIPGSSLLVGTAAAHHNITAGSLFLLDSSKGEDGLAPITRLTPECPFPESEGWKLGGTFCSPMPVNDTLFFCSYSDDPLSFPREHPRSSLHKGCGAAWPRRAAYAVYLVDTLGGRELIYQDPEYSTFSPIPMVKRKMPPALASVLPPRETAPSNGVCYVENVYETRTDLPKGSVKALRVNKIINLPICRRRTSEPSDDLDLYKETLGTVPVSAAGSAAFHIPAGEPIQLQALDHEGKAILTMRSFIYSQKGEIQGCVGCHEAKNTSMPKYVQPPESARLGKVDDPVPEVDLGYAGPVSFRRSIQPIFDAKCISCHGLAPTNAPKAAFPLTADVAVNELVKRSLVANIFSYRETHYSKCYDYFTGASRLWTKLGGGHGPALTPEEKKKIILWLDQGVSIYASAVGYGWNGPEAREVDAEGEKRLRAAVRDRLGEAAAAWPLDALVNRADETLSHVLDLVGGKGSADYARFLELCRGVFKPMLWQDKAGTCGRDDACECRSCWVRRAGYNLPPSREAGYRLYNIVPMYVGHEQEQAAQCVAYCARTGEDLALYSLSLHPEGRPALDKVTRYLASYRAFAQALEGTAVRPGILVQSILGHWPRTDKDIEPWQRSIDSKGQEVRFCPLDPGFSNYVHQTFVAVARAKPAFILTDDDVRAFSPEAECFCPRHVARFNARHGTSYDGAALRAAVTKSRPGDRVYEDFLALQRETVEKDVVGVMRRAIDSVDPSIPAGVCVVFPELLYGAPLARAIAAKGQRPVLRCPTGCYGERIAADWFPYVFGKMLGQVEYFRGSGVTLLDEADTCPQNLWSKSARSFLTHMATSCFVGMEGAKTWYVNGIRANGFPVTHAYTDVLAENRGFLNALHASVAGSRLDGLAIPCLTNNASWHLCGPPRECLLDRKSALSFACIPFGVPVRASMAFGDPDTVFLLTTAEEVGLFSEAELQKLFSGRVLVFRDAAVELTRRGRSDLTGVKAEMKPLLFTGERLNASGQVLLFKPSSGSVCFTAAEGAERLGDLVFSPYAGAANVETVSPSTVYYRNRLGGRVATVAYHGDMMPLHQFSEGRKQWFVDLVDRLAEKPVVHCGNDQDVLMVERAGTDGTRTFLAVNLNSEPIRELRLRLAGEPEIEVLSPNGAWRKVQGKREGAFLSLPVPVGFYETVVVRCRMR